MPHTVLVVDPDSAAALTTARSLEEAGFLVTTSDNFDEAQRRLKFAQPDMLVTAVRLAGYNGLHLVIKGTLIRPDLRAIVLADAVDAALSKDAVEQGAAFLMRPVSGAQLCATAQNLLHKTSVRAATEIARRWPRKATSVTAQIGAIGARVLDVSYGGLRLEVPAITEEALLTGEVKVTVQDKSLTVAACAVWARRLRGATVWWCGLEAVDASPRAVAEWRNFVDAMH